MRKVGRSREYPMPRGVHINVHEGERVRADEQLMDGPRKSARGPALQKRRRSRAVSSSARRAREEIGRRVNVGLSRALVCHAKGEAES
jgi:hypothetical protein